MRDGDHKSLSLSSDDRNYLLLIRWIIMFNLKSCNLIYFSANDFNLRLFLERREEELQQMLAQFSATNMMDEKTELVVQFLNRMWAGLEQEPMFAATNDEQRAEAR